MKIKIELAQPTDDEKLLVTFGIQDQDDAKHLTDLMSFSVDEKIIKATEAVKGMATKMDNDDPIDINMGVRFMDGAAVKDMGAKEPVTMQPAAPTADDPEWGWVLVQGEDGKYVPQHWHLTWIKEKGVTHYFPVQQDAQFACNDLNKDPYQELNWIQDHGTLDECLGVDPDRVAQFDTLVGILLTQKTNQLEIYREVEKRMQPTREEWVAFSFMIGFTVRTIAGV